MNALRNHIESADTGVVQETTHKPELSHEISDAIASGRARSLVPFLVVLAAACGPKLNRDPIISYETLLGPSDELEEGRMLVQEGRETDQRGQLVGWLVNKSFMKFKWADGQTPNANDARVTVKDKTVTIELCAKGKENIGKLGVTKNIDDHARAATGAPRVTATNHQATRRFYKDEAEETVPAGIVFTIEFASEDAAQEAAHSFVSFEKWVFARDTDSDGIPDANDECELDAAGTLSGCRPLAEAQKLDNEHPPLHSGEPSSVDYPETLPLPNRFELYTTIKFKLAVNEDPTCKPGETNKHGCVSVENIGDVEGGFPLPDMGTFLQTEWDEVQRPGETPETRKRRVKVRLFTGSMRKYDSGKNDGKTTEKPAFDGNHWYRAQFRVVNGTGAARTETWADEVTLENVEDASVTLEIKLTRLAQGASNQPEPPAVPTDRQPAPPPPAYPAGNQSTAPRRAPFNRQEADKRAWRRQARAQR